ncbi:MAG: hypothetical protein AAFY38_17155 [Pseudomonadota bacterium]
MELKAKGDFTKFSDVSEARMVRAATAAMNEYLATVTGKVAKRTRRGSAGQERLKDYKVEQSAPGAIDGKVTLTRGLGLSEFGGVIRAKNVQYMTIPLKGALGRDGKPKKPRARDWHNTRVIRSKRGALLIVQRRAGKDIPLYALKREVRIPARLGLRREMTKQQRVFWRALSHRVAQII